MENENIVTLQLKVTRDRALLLLALFFLCWHPGPLGSETLQLTTYYPAPYGGYVSLMTTNRTILARDAGTVGVGNNPNPNFTNKFDVWGAGNRTVDMKVNGRMQTGDANGNGGVWLGTANDALVGNFNTVMGFSTDGTSPNVMSITKTSGFVGIGTTGPTRRFQVRGDVRIGDVGVGGTGTLYGLCHIRNFGGGISRCDNGTIITAIYGQECQTGGVLLRANSTDIHLASNWIPHMAQNCSGQMLCCRIGTSN